MLFAIIDPRCGGPMAYYAAPTWPKDTDPFHPRSLRHADGTPVDEATPLEQWRCETCGEMVVFDWGGVRPWATDNWKLARV